MKTENEILLDFDITQLKAKIQNIKNSLIEKNNLLSQRQDIENKLLEIYSLKFKSNRKDHFFLQLKRKQIEIDHRLDEIEELNETDLLAAQSLLVDKILTTHPERVNEYNVIVNQINSLLKKEQTLITFCELCHKIKINLSQIQIIRKGIKSRGILNYIFGISPNKKIERNLIEIQKTTSLLIDHIKTCNNLTLANFEQWLLILDKQLKSTWGFKLIDTFFKQSLIDIENHLIEFEYFLNTTQKEKSEKENVLEIWIETF